jgi:hypothetical protein
LGKLECQEESLQAIRVMKGQAPDRSTPGQLGWIWEGAVFTTVRPWQDACKVTTATMVHRPAGKFAINGPL